MSWKEYPQNIKVRLITSFFNRAVSSSVMPFMALFFAHETNKLWAGTFLLLTVVISFFVNLLGGYISDRFQRKKVLLFTSSSSALMFLLMTISLVPKDNIIWLFAVCYVLFIVASSLGRPAMNAIIIDSTTPENRKSVLTIEYWLSNLSMAIGAAIGGLLFLNYQIELFVLLTLTSSTLPIAYRIWLIDEHRFRLKKQHQNLFVDLFQNYRIAFQDSPFVKVVAGTAFILAAEFTMNSYIGVRLAESFHPIHLGDFEIAGVQMLSILNIQNMLIVVCFTFLINKWTDRYSRPKMLIFGLMIYGIGYVTVTSANQWYILILFSQIATLGELIYSPVLNVEKANMIPEDKRGSYSAFSNISFSGADGIARLTIILGAYFIPSMMSVFMGMIIMLGIILAYTGLFLRRTSDKAVLMNKITT